MRRIFSFLLTTMLMLTLFTTTTFAETIDSIYVDGNKVTLEAPLKNINNTNWIPLSSVKNTLGATITWSGDTATVKDGDTTLVLTINSNKYVKNGTTFYSQYQPTKVDNQVYLHMKFLYNTLGYTLNHQSNPTKISIDKTKPATWDNYFVDTANYYTLSFDDTYGFRFTYPHMSSKPNVYETYVKNMKTGEFRLVHSSKQKPDPVWTKDNRLIFLGEENSKPNYMIYNANTMSVSKLGTANSSGGVYLQPKNCFIYLSNSTYYSYDLGANTNTQITKAKYDELVKSQSDKAGDGKVYNIYIDDRKLEMDIEPQNFDSSLYVPLSFISKELGATVSWQSPNITIKKGDLNLVLTANSNTYTKNGVTYYTQYKPIIYNSRTYVPLRFISNVFGYPVDFTASYSNKGGGTIKIDTTKQVTSANTFIEDNSTFTLSPNREYGYKVEGKATVYLKNMTTGAFKELYVCSGHFSIKWINTNQLIIGGNRDPFTGEYRDCFMLYDPTTDKMSIIVDAYYGGYVESLNAFAHSTTEYRSDATSDVGSSFYLRDMKTGKDTQITQDEFYKYIYTPEHYEIYLKSKPQ